MGEVIIGSKARAIRFVQSGADIAARTSTRDGEAGRRGDTGIKTGNAMISQVILRFSIIFEAFRRIRAPPVLGSSQVYLSIIRMPYDME